MVRRWAARLSIVFSRKNDEGRLKDAKCARRRQSMGREGGRQERTKLIQRQTLAIWLMPLRSARMGRKSETHKTRWLLFFLSYCRAEQRGCVFALMPRRFSKCSRWAAQERCPAHGLKDTRVCAFGDDAFFSERNIAPPPVLKGCRRSVAVSRLPHPLMLAWVHTERAEERPAPPLVALCCTRT
jgi:hypothetical protein